VRVERLVADGPGGPAYDVVFADPPYDLPDDDLRAVLAVLRPALSDDAVLAVERATRGGEWRWPEGYVGLRSRRYGEATLWYGRAAAAGSEQSERTQ
jgi:16S rRNA (guanine966-N2)-methyltransferase